MKRRVFYLSILVLMVFLLSSCDESETYTITFDTNGGSAIPSIDTKGNRLDIPDDPVKEGYVFDGWYYDNGTFEEPFDPTSLPDDPLLEDLTLYAKWIDESTFPHFDVTFDVDGGSTIDTVSVREGQRLDEPEEPTKEGYDFVGWFRDESLTEAWDFQTDVVTEDTTLYAQWNEVILILHTVTFDVDGGTTIDPVDVIEGESVDEPEEPTKDGYDFVGWFQDESLTEAWDFQTDVVTEDTTLYARWTIRMHAVTFDTDQGSTIDSVEVAYGESVDEPGDPAKEGHDFVGWFRDESLTETWDFQTDVVTEDTTLYARWTVRSYTVTYMLDEPTFEPVSVSYGDLVPEPELEDPYDEGFTLLWFEDEARTTPYTFETMPAADLTIYGVLREDHTRDFLGTEPSTVIPSVDYLSLYFDYMFFNRIEEVTVTLDYDFDTIPDEVGTAFDNLLLQVNVSMSYSYFENGNEIDISATYDEQAVIAASEEPAYVQRNALVTALTATRDETFDDFAVDQITETYAVTTSDQLYYVLEQGYRPIFTEPDTPAEAMYLAARDVLRDIVDDSMTAIEKLEAIYQYLVFEITYDHALLDKLLQNEDNIHQYNGFYLEGVFVDKRVVCDGFSKAFTVMGRIEGLEVIRVIGKPADPENTVLHAWNKVNLDGDWYVIDATSANLIINQAYEVFTYKFFLITDEMMEEYYIATSHLDIIAATPYNHYQQRTFVVDGITYDFYIESQEELNALLRYYEEVDHLDKTQDAYIAFDYGEEIDDELIAALGETGLATIRPIITGNILIFFVTE
jgi:uncharacterized repeat protein (TIGR02543 family)